MEFGKALKGGKIHPHLPYKGRIAICFLVTRNIRNYKLWKKWMKGYERYISIYVHISGPRFYKHNPTSKYKFDDLAWTNRIRNPHKTQWGDISLIMAEGLLYKQALEEPENKYFCLLSESGIPVRSFEYTYNNIFSNPKNRMNISSMKNKISYVNYEAPPTPSGNPPGIFKECFPKKYLPKNWKASYQWKILNRWGAKEFISMINDYEYMQAYKNCFLLDPYQLAPDEVAYVNWIIINYGNKGLYSKFLNRETTYADFDPLGEHALTYGLISPELHSILCEDPDILFARKFKKNLQLDQQLPLEC